MTYSQYSQYRFGFYLKPSLGIPLDVSLLITLVLGFLRYYFGVFSNPYAFVIVTFFAIVAVLGLLAVSIVRFVRRMAANATLRSGRPTTGV